MLSRALHDLDHERAQMTVDLVYGIAAKFHALDERYKEQAGCGEYDVIG